MSVELERDPLGRWLPGRRKGLPSTEAVKAAVQKLVREPSQRPAESAFGPIFERSNYSGWLLSDREEVLDRLEREGVGPRFENVVCEHVTFRYPDDECAPAPKSVRCVGYAYTDEVDVLLVEVDGNTERPDGKLFHVTLSTKGDVPPAKGNDAAMGGERVLFSSFDLGTEPF